MVAFDEIMHQNSRFMDEMFIKFISGQNTILIRNETDFERFICLLEWHRVIFVLNNPGKYRNYEEWKNLAVENGKNPDIFCFEYQPGKGLSWYDNVEKSTEWYGEEPMVIPEPELLWL